MRHIVNTRRHSEPVDSLSLLCDCALKTVISLWKCIVFTSLIIVSSSKRKKRGSMKPWALLQKTQQLQISTTSYFHYWKLAWLFQTTKITLFLTFDKGFASKLRVKTRHTKCVDPTLPLVVLHSNESNVSRKTSSTYWLKHTVQTISTGGFCWWRCLVTGLPAVLLHTAWNSVWRSAASASRMLGVKRQAPL